MSIVPHVVELRSYPPGKWGWFCTTEGCHMWRGDLTSRNAAIIDAQSHVSSTWGQPV
jgi:hypothetical protein